MGKIRDLFFKTQGSPDAEPRPSRLLEITHPPKNAARYARMEAELDRRAEVSRATYKADAAYAEWAGDPYHGGNPPESATRAQASGWYAEQYPEVSQAELDQIESEKEQFAQGPRGERPEFEGPGFTEPPLNWCGENHQGWTFTGWALERGYSEEQVEEINREFPPDRAEIEAGARWSLEKAEEEQRYADVDARRTDDEPPWDNRSAEWYTWHDGVMGQIAQAEEDAGRDLSRTEIADFWVRAGDSEPDDGGGRRAANFEREP